MSDTDDFHGEVRVASSIVDYLSSGLYESPAACLKELINNAYDADATLVRVFVKPDADRIIIDDNGCGFTKHEFIQHFQRVSESAKRKVSDKTDDLHRKKIGLIGIGLIAANEICEEMEIFSTVRGSTELLRVTVDFREMRKPQNLRRREGDDVAKGDYRGTIEAAEPDEHYTRLFLKEVRGHAREVLVGATRARGIAGTGRSLYGLRPDSVRDRLLREDLTTWSSLDFYSQTMLKVALNVPVQYADHWLPSPEIKRATAFSGAVDALEFAVEYDGTELRKPTVLQPGDDGRVFHTFEMTGEHVAAKGYLYAKHRALRPEELNGILIRIRNAAVGEYDSSFMAFPKTIGTLFQRWISGEVWADDRLEDAMNIDRRTLRESHPAYAELQASFHRELQDFLRKVRSDLWGKPSDERRDQRESAEVARIGSLITEAMDSSRVSRRAATRIIEMWAGVERSRALRRYAASDVYTVFLDIANETLTPRDRDRLIQELTRRLVD